MVCNVSVLLPIPGSPPSNTIEPGTNPPPSTRLSSPSRMSMRGSSLADMLRSGSGREPPELRPRLTDEAADAADAWPAVSAATRISLNVFHWPQLGHLPIHLADSCPQLEHT